MKKLLVLSLAISVASSGFAQKGKNKPHPQMDSREETRRVILGEPKNKQEKQGKENNNTVWEGTSASGGPKPSKNQPAKVRQAFAADYPQATNIQWSKYRGDWTATFTNSIGRSTAVYHANGQRKDTRTVVDRPQLPPAIESIFRKRPALRIGNIVRIELPVKEDNLFRVQTIDGGTSLFTVYNSSGQTVKYDY